MSKAHVWNLLFERGRGRFEMNLKTRKDTKQVKSQQTLQLCWTSLPLYNRPTYTLKEPKLDTVDFFTPIYLASFVSKLNDDHHTVNVICIFVMWWCLIFGAAFRSHTPDSHDGTSCNSEGCWWLLPWCLVLFISKKECLLQSIDHQSYHVCLNFECPLIFLWLLEKTQVLWSNLWPFMAIFPFPNLSHSQQPGCLAGVPSDRQSMGSQLAFDWSSLPNPEGHPVSGIFLREGKVLSIPYRWFWENSGSGDLWNWYWLRSM